MGYGAMRLPETASSAENLGACGLWLEDRNVASLDATVL
jgi:hypothetical protein